MAFPSSGVYPFIPKVDLTDTVWAAHVNTLQTELAATQTAIGTDVLSGSAYTTTAWVDPASAPYSSVAARLANIEHGLLNGLAGAPYLWKTGGQIDAPSGSVSLIIKAATGSTSNLLETKTSASATGFKVDYTGAPFVGTAEVLYSGSTAYNSVDSRIAALEASSGGAFSPFLLAGM
jgi:hypothetical protein